jgi:ATP-dependent RNA helicase DHX8/PRP22
MQRAGRAGRTRAGKCYRLYPLSTYEHELLATTVPEIQRSSLTGAVLHLKSLDLPNLDILRFDFIDQPSMESLEDALRQLFVIDAIHSDGTITTLGKHMAGKLDQNSRGMNLMKMSHAVFINNSSLQDACQA